MRLLRQLWEVLMFLGTGAFVLFVLILLISPFYLRSKFRYEITVPAGRTTTQHYTNVIRMDSVSNCIFFLDSGNLVRVCGSYTIKKNSSIH